MKKFVALLTASAAFASTAAFAADPAPRLRVKRLAVSKPLPPAPAPLPLPIAPLAYNWAGFYIGGNGGWGFASDTRIAIGANFFAPAGGTQRVKAEGAMYGGKMGYNWQLGSFVYGVEVSGGVADIQRTDRSIFFPATDTISTKLDATIVGTGRLGFALDNFMPYLKAGYGAAHVQNTNAGAGQVLTTQQWQNGYVVGGGIDIALMRNWVLGVEYTYMDFGSKISAGTLPGIAAAQAFNDKLTVSAVTGRLSYKFNTASLLDTPLPAPLEVRY